MRLRSGRIRSVWRPFVWVILGLGVGLPMSPVQAQQTSYNWVLLAGGDNATYRDGVRHLARFKNLSDVARDAEGNLYVTDIDDHIVRKITPNGTVTTLAGLAGTSGSADGQGAAARFLRPDGVAVDANGVVFVADSGNYTIRRITPDGIVSTFAGSAGIQAYVDGQGTEARFTFVRQLRFDALGNLITYETPQVCGCGVLRRISSSGGVATFTTRAAGPVAIDPAGYLFVINGYAIDRVSASGVITRLAGHPEQRASTDGVGLSARFLAPVALTADASGRLYVVEYQPTLALRRVTADGTVTTIPTFLDSRGTIAELEGVAVALPSGDLVFAGGRTVKGFSPGGFVSNIAGSSGFGGEDGVRQAAQFRNPQQIALDQRGHLFVADTFNNTIRRVSTSIGQVTTVAGLAQTPGYSRGFVGVGPALFRNPYGVTVRPDGIAVLSDTHNGVLRTVQQVGSFYTGEVAGAPGEFGTTDGQAATARFTRGHGTQMAADVSGTVYVTEPAAHTIRRITSDGVVTTLAGTPGEAGTTDGTGSAARFNAPKGIVVGSDGLIYVADSLTVRRVTPAGVVTTIGGTRGGTTLTMDTDGTLLVGDGDLYRLTMAGALTVIGNPDIGRVGGVAVGASGEVYLSLNNAGGPEVNRVWVGFTAPLSAPVIGSVASATVTAGGTTQFTTTVTGGVPAPQLHWQQSSDGGTTWTDLHDFAPYSGARTATLSLGPVAVSFDRYLYRLVATSLAGVTTSQSAQLNVIGLRTSASPLQLAARLTASQLLDVSPPPMVVAVTSTGVANQAWTAAGNQAWMQITNGAGTGDGEFSVGVTSGAGSGITAPGIYSGIVTVQSSTTGASAQITVRLEVVRESTAANPPFGQVDTPTQNVSGVVGAIGVTGWVLDDTGVTSVKIYRNCLAGEFIYNCATVLGNSVVFVGDAAFLPGARPDVENMFQNHPMANRAGWGFMVLTPMLPHVTGQRTYGGQGPLTLYVVATDTAGNKTLLGRTTNAADAGFAMPTQITMANDSIAKPFGAIDTPGQGVTVSGVLHNFGWALTPDSNTTGGEGGDILIPTNGSTMTVFIDGMPVATVACNQCRGDVGNPVPAGVFCNDDVSNIFGNATPQNVLTSRTANTTLFRNLDAGRAPIGAYSFNTATLTNGLHTIAWSVTDSAGRTEGIGSRFFTVLNSGADQQVRTVVR